MPIDRHGLLELHAIAQERGDGLIPGLYDLLCGSLSEGVFPANVIDIEERIKRNDQRLPAAQLQTNLRRVGN